MRFVFLPLTFRRMREDNVFTPVCSQGVGGTPTSGSRSHWSQVLSRMASLWSQVPSKPLVSGPSQGVSQPLVPGPFWGGKYPSIGVTPHPTARKGVPLPPDRLHCGRYASCGFAQEDFLVILQQCLIYDSGCASRNNTGNLGMTFVL